MGLAQLTKVTLGLHYVGLSLGLARFQQGVGTQRSDPCAPPPTPSYHKCFLFQMCQSIIKKNHISESILKEGLDRQWQTKESRDCKTEYKISFPFRQI